jgi:hypothetical protein
MMPFGNHDFRELSRNGTLPVSCIRSVAKSHAQSSAVHHFLLHMEQHSKFAVTVLPKVFIGIARSIFQKLSKVAERIRSQHVIVVRRAARHLSQRKVLARNHHLLRQRILHSLSQLIASRYCLLPEAPLKIGIIPIVLHKQSRVALTSPTAQGGLFSTNACSTTGSCSVAGILNCSFIHAV